MTIKVAFYARYSSDLQRDASIEDQVRLCQEKADKEGWQVYKCYTDAGISGASLLRPGIQSLMQDAMNGEFDIIVCEAIDRLSRDQEDIAGLFKRMEFANIQINTLSEGVINAMHIGLKGTMNAMFLKDLADKTRRGIRGRIENGKVGGGISYGYKVVKHFDAHGEAIKGDREIIEHQAEIIRRVFREYANDNKSPKAIAAQLNKESIVSPSGGQWSQSTINGNRKRGTGILNNDLYRGVLVWNRQHFVKDPSTGRRVTRMNDESEWIRKEVPKLRIVPQVLWDAAKHRHSKLDRKAVSFNRKTRPKYLLSGLLECGQCGGGFAKVNDTRYGCSVSRNKGDSACGSRKTIKREDLEAIVLNALQTHLMRDDLLEVFCEEFTQHLNLLRREQVKGLSSLKREYGKLVKERESLVQSLKDGIPAAIVKDDLISTTENLEKMEKKIKLREKNGNRPIIHPSMAKMYRDQIETLTGSLKSEAHNGEAMEHIRSLVEKIILTPKEGQKELQIDLYGDLAGILTIATQGRVKQSGEANARPLEKFIANDNQFSWKSEIANFLVARGGFEPPTPSL